VIGTSAPPDAPQIREWLADHLRRECGLDDDALDADDAGLELDSVEKVSLLGSLETWLGRTLPQDALAECLSVDALAERLVVLLRDGATAGVPDSAGAARPRDSFVECVNPHLGERLQKLEMDKRFVHGAGSWLSDADGRRYLDFVGAFGALPFGHNPPEIWDAIRAVEGAQPPTFVQPSALDAAGRLAERLLALAPPGLRYVTFANSGTEAVEAAIKLCRAATGRLGVLSTRRGFHGKTLGALSATGNVKYQKPFGAPVPGFEVVPYGDPAALRAALERAPERYAAFLVEPIQGEGGIVEPPPEYLAAAKEACAAHGVLLVSDEVQTGLGRTGALFASAAAGLRPDVLVLAKALGGGLLPIGACLCTAAAYTRDFGLNHSSTFAGNTLACTVGLAVLDLLERDDGAIVRHVDACGRRFKEALQAIAGRHPVVAGVRGRGFFLGLELGVDRDGWPWSILGVAAEQELLPAVVSSYLLNVEGVRVAPTLNGSTVLRIEPPLTATWEECEAVVGALDRALGVLETRDAGGMLASVLERRARPLAARPPRPPQEPVAARPGEPTFAILIHPLAAADYAHFDATMGGLEPAVLEDVAQRVGGLLDPFVASRMRIVSPSGASAVGHLIIVGRTADELVALPRPRAVAEIRDAVDVARELGAELVGLGAYTSVVTSGGVDVADAGVGVTTGNSYTVVTGCEALALAVGQRGRALADCTAAVVGAAGSIGGAAVPLLAEQVRRLVLVGNPARPAAHERQRLLAIAADACRHLVRQHEGGRRFAAGSLAERLLGLPDLPAGDRAVDDFLDVAGVLERDYGALLLSQALDVALPLADVVLTATSTTRAIVGARHLKPGATVCDLSRPRNVSEEVVRRRPDVLVIDGGVVEVPGRPFIGPCGLDEGLAYACMAETMVLALDGRRGHFGLGARLSLEGLAAVRDAARAHGFRVARLRSFGRVLDATDWARLQRPPASAVAARRRRDPSSEPAVSPVGG
jgi:acetylornithine/succinyldiaminopimelate/putrescine aminotransferase/predicted amino acid dehydrogenase/acyl carrier protein